MSQKILWFSGVASAAFGMLVVVGIAYAVVPTLSQTGITVGLGQSISVTSNNGTNVYMGSNSSPTIASVSINGTQITVTGQGLGSTTVSICTVGTSSDCTNLAVAVQAASVSGISFSQSNLSLSIGGNQSVTVSGGNGTYTISSNSNTSVVSTNLSGSTLAVSGLAAGGATIKVCDTSGTCGTLSVTISSSGSSSTSGLSFNQNNISLIAGGSQVVTVSGGNGAYNISNNSNVNTASAGISGNGITVYAIAAGNAAITVCDTSNVCGQLSIIVTASAANQAVIFSVANPTLTVGQNLNVGLSGSNAPSYIILSNTNTNIVQASVTNGVTLSLSGVSAGTDSLAICATGGGCSTFSVTVTGATSTTTPATIAATTTTASPTALITQSGTGVVNANLLDEIKTLQAAVTQILTQIQSIQTQINQLEVQVSAGSGSDSGANANTSVVTNTTPGISYNFTETLTLGSQDAQVTALQQRLTTLGFYTGPITGYYGALTEGAVVKYQTAHGITATGYTGPGTRTALNAGN